jgi:hypothetical protein
MFIQSNPSHAMQTYTIWYVQIRCGSAAACCVDGGNAPSQVSSTWQSAAFPFTASVRSLDATPLVIPLGSVESVWSIFTKRARNPTSTDCRLAALEATSKPHVMKIGFDWFSSQHPTNNLVNLLPLSKLNLSLSSTECQCESTRRPFRLTFPSLARLFGQSKVRVCYAIVYLSTPDRHLELPR